MQIKDKARKIDGDQQKLVLTIVASAEEVDRSARDFFKEIAQKDIPGFRKVKAPRGMLEQVVGGHANAMGGVAETLINELGFKAIDEEGVLYIAEPQFNVEDMIEEGKPFTFTVSGLVAPDLPLANYDPVDIEMPPDMATEKEIDGQLRELQDCYHSFEAISDPDHQAELGDYVEVVTTVSNHGKPIPGLSSASRMIGLGKGTMPATFDENVIGAKAGDILDFDFEAKDADGAAALGDGELHASVEVKGFRALVLPAIDDDLAAKVGCSNVKEMREQLAYAINMQKSKELPKLMVDRAIEQLVARLDAEVPSYYVDFIRQDVGRELIQSLEKQGTSLQHWMLENSINGDQMKEDIAQEAQRRAAIDCALEALFVEKGWEVTDEDIDLMFAEEGAVEGTREDWASALRMASLLKMCRQSKVTRWLVDTANVTVVEEDAA